MTKKWTFTGGKPVSVSNEQFVKSAFGKDSFRTHVTGFLEDPGTLDTTGKRHYWGGGPWSSMSGVASQAQHNNFFCISVFNPDPVDGKYRRRKVAFERCYVIVFDDVNLRNRPASDTSAKVDADKVIVDPSWILETSPFNFQVGYFIVDKDGTAGDGRGGKVTALLELLVQSGLVSDGTDPGMKGVTRYVRLPTGRNTKGKYGSLGFEQVMTGWHPDRTYTLEYLAKAHGLEAEFLEADDDLNVGGAGVTMDPDGDWIVGTLSATGKILSEDRAKSLWHVECPFVDEHTGRENTGTAYLGDGRWTCYHGHCCDRDHGEFTDRLRDLFPKEAAEAKTAAVKHQFDDGQTFEKGVPERVRIAEEYAEIADMFGEEAAEDQKVARVLGPFQAKMERGFTLGDAIRRGAILDQAWLLKGICPVQGLGVLYGPPGTGKSFVMLDMMMRMTMEMKWQGHRWKRECLGLYVASEGGKADLNNRLGAWASHHGVVDGDPLIENFMVFPGSFGIGDGEVSKAEIDKLIMWLKGWSKRVGLPVGMVTLDTLNRNMLGDENSTADMTAMVQACDRITREVGCFVMLVHHTGKDEAKGARGSSALRGAADLELQTDREIGVMEGAISVAKNRAGEDGARLGYHMEHVDLGTDADGDEVNSLVIVETAAPKKVVVLKGKQQTLMDIFLAKVAFAPGGIVPVDVVTQEAASTTTEPPSIFKRELKKMAKKGVLIYDEQNVTLQEL